ncbi:MAG: histidine kinase [Verrucomicrobiota bacterium]
MVLKAIRTGAAVAAVVAASSLVQAEVLISDVGVDGTFISAKVGSTQGVAIPFGARDVRFRFESVRKAEAGAMRVRYKLEGFDNEWRDPIGEMVIRVRLSDAVGNLVGGSRIAFSGESPGWQGHPESAQLLSKTLTLTAPDAASSLELSFISNGGHENVGSMVIDNVRVRISANTGPSSLIEFDASTGEHMERPMGLPAKWRRDGDRPEIAQILWREKPAPHAALFLNDIFPEGAGTWVSKRTNVPIGRGDQITVEWDTAYSIGRGGKGTVQYENLAPGNYLFRVAEADVNGLLTGVERSVPVVVKAAFYQRLGFWVGLLGCTALGGAMLKWILVKRELSAKVAKAERQHLLEVERARIARDIHDDLGATLAQIAMLSELAKDEDATSSENNSLDEIFNRARSATRKLDEIVWAINPSNDNLEHLVSYLCEFTEDYLKLAKIRFRMEAPRAMPDAPLTSSQRHHLFLAAKEALHNIVKHAEATEVWLRFALIGNRLSVRIEDNGKGLPANVANDEHGSANMKTRMAQIGGSYERSSGSVQGTTVELSIPLAEVSL